MGPGRFLRTRGDAVKTGESPPGLYCQTGPYKPPAAAANRRGVDSGGARCVKKKNTHKT